MSSVNELKYKYQTKKLQEETARAEQEEMRKTLKEAKMVCIRDKWTGYKSKNRHRRVHQTERILLDIGNRKQGVKKPYEREKYLKTTHAGRAKRSPVSE